MKKLLVKKPKINKKNQELCTNFQLETHFQALQNTVASISEVDISILYGIKFFSTTNQIKSKKIGPLDEKTTKNGYLNVQFNQKLLFKVKKSFTKRSA